MEGLQEVVLLLGPQVIGLNAEHSVPIQVCFWPLHSVQMQRPRKTSKD